MHDVLFQPITLGAIEAPNRILMAPLTRGRSSPGSVPNAMMVEYYRQRASAGLIITEATGISVEGLGWPAAPGIWTDAQVEGWKPVIEAVHQAGGQIVLQMWHMGRLVHPDFLGGNPPVSASATCAPGNAHTPEGTKLFEPARALGIDEIARVVDDYGHAAENAKKAGFDGVQLHGANGYLIDQFLRDGTNLREDAYGGT
ncbi:MAG: alkene reductase, partial [Novosphingobium sp.]|nr:alkene reductase [Novosphingobium sp.]